MYLILSDPGSQAESGLVSTRMGDHLGILGAVGFSFGHFFSFGLLWAKGQPGTDQATWKEGPPTSDKVQNLTRHAANLQRKHPSGESHGQGRKLRITR